MSEFLHIERLRLRRMPGFPSGGPVLKDLSPGINLVAGPNASGKSTTARAVQHLLWPGDGNPEISLSGVCRSGNERWQADLDGRRIQWNRDGRQIAPPAVPPLETRARYLLSLHALLRDEDQELAARIQIESAGGFDVPAAAHSLGFGSPGRPNKLVTAYRNAVTAAREALGKANELREKRKRLEQDRDELKALETASSRVRSLELAVRFAEARAHLTEAETRLASYPDVLARVDGKELQVLEEIRGQIGEIREDIGTYRSRRAEAENELRDTGLGEDGVRQQTVSEMRSRLASIREIERDIRLRRNNLSALIDESKEADVEIQQGAELPDDLLDRLETYLRTAEELLADKTRLDVRLLEVEKAEQEATPDADELREALNVLRRWLQADENADRLHLFGPVALLIIGLLLASLALAQVVTSAILLILSVVSVAIGLWLLVRSRQTDTSGRDALEKEARAHGIVPDAWRIDEILGLIERLEKELAVANELSVRTSRRTELEAERSALQKRLEALESERARLVALLPFPVTSDLSLHAAGTRWVDFVRRRRERFGERAGLAEASEALESELKRLQQKLGEWNYHPEDSSACEAAIEDLDNRRERHARALHARDEALRRIDDLEMQVQDAESRMDALFERLGLNGKEREVELRRLVEQVEAYTDSARSLEVAKRECERARKELERLAETGDAAAVELSERKDLNADALVGELEHAREAESDASELSLSVAATDKELSLARRGHDVEQALATEAQARNALAEQRELDVEAAVGGALAEWLGRHETTEVRPAVFDRADLILSEITRGRYRLRISGEDVPTFGAYDAQAEQLRALDELSAGTRLQVLLAVRVAFIETQESGVAPPLLLDEVLANSDDIRAQAIIEATVALARAGRQIFYFTAQADELARWRSRLRNESVDWKEFRLDAASASGSGFDWETEDRGASDLPLDDSLSFEAYGKAAGVTAFDPWTNGVGSLHLWQVLTDKAMLHTLLSDGIQTWGQLRNYADRAGTKARSMIQAARSEAEPRAELVERFAELYRRGRGRHVDRAALVASEAVSDVFLDALTDLAADLGGDGRALLDAIRDGRVQRFRSDKCDELEEYLRREGYIDDARPIEPRDLTLHVMAESEKLGLNLTRDECEIFIRRLARGPSGSES